MLIGYARVSTDGQHADLQEDALRAAGCERTYTDLGQSGAKAHRPQLDLMLATLREGDVVVVWRLDRLGRSVRDLVDLVGRFEREGVQFRSLSEGIDTTTPTGKLTFHIFAAIAEFERDLIRERTRAGLEAARARGRRGGRPSLIDETLIAKVRRYYIDRGLTGQETARQTGVSLSTVNRTLRVIRDRDRERKEGER